MTEKQLEQMRINSTRNPMTITSAYKAGALDMQEKMIEKACIAIHNMMVDGIEFCLDDNDDIMREIRRGMEG